MRVCMPARILNVQIPCEFQNGVPDDVHTHGRSEREDLAVEAHKVTNSKTGAETSGLFYPQEGDCIVALNYVSFRVPPDWLDVDPPTGAKSWNTEGRRSLWKVCSFCAFALAYLSMCVKPDSESRCDVLQDFIETVWHRQLEKALRVQPSYLELERGIPGWLGTTWEPYGLSLSWSVPCDLWGSVMSMHETCVCVCVCVCVC